MTLEATMQHFLTMDSINKSEFEQILDLAIEQKNIIKNQGVSYLGEPLKSKSVSMIFEKPSLRTRVSFEVAINQLGGNAIYLAPSEVGIGSREPISDAARVISRYCSIAILRTYDQSTIDQFAKSSSIPVINALSGTHHPLQALADYMTIKENFGSTKNVEIAYIGDAANNVATSLIAGAKLAGSSIRVSSPRGYDPIDKSILVHRNPADAIKNADVVYTDVFTSMGFDLEHEKRMKDFKGFTITDSLMKQAKPGAIFMHDLPAHDTEEVTREVLEAKYSRIFDQAENRLHTQRALISIIIR